MGAKERGRGGKADRQIHTTSILDSARVSREQGGPMGSGVEGRLLWNMESLNGHSNISIFVSAFTLACAPSVKDGRKADVCQTGRRNGGEEARRRGRGARKRGCARTRGAWAGSGGLRRAFDAVRCGANARGPSPRLLT